MKRTLLDRFEESVPKDLLPQLMGAKVYDSSCSPEARVWLIDRDGGYYLKRGVKGSLWKEAEMTRYFHKKGLGAEVLGYFSEDYDWLLTSRVAGEDCTYGEYLADPKRLCDTIAQQLRALHELDFSDCPVWDRMPSYFALAEENYRTGNYDKTAFPDSFGYASADEAYKVLQNGKNTLDSRVLLHGDYCLPNIMLDHWRFSGFIDLGNGGVGDRHIDLFWGAWTLGFNLKTDAYRERFFDAYGRDLVDPEKIKTVAAAEVFG
ncbi:MAG: aminoglycoside 3'-phosphotransferase [Clostridia bacterium]|nr:aminoglycoside 3'-phosphotransferase [Clostridia bacterium]